MDYRLLSSFEFRVNFLYFCHPINKHQQQQRKSCNFPNLGAVLPVSQQTLPELSRKRDICRLLIRVHHLSHRFFFKKNMLFLSNRIKICSLAFTAARLCSNGPATANKNPTVYFDIAADGQPLGRVTFEVGRKRVPIPPWSLQ